MYRSSLVPRLIPAIGLVGGVLMTSSVIGQILGINEKISVWSLIALLPIFLGAVARPVDDLQGFRGSALMVEAAAEAQSPHGSAPAVLSPIAVATTAGAA
jgi:hypothetical protein